MSEVQTASITIASAGVFVAAVYYVLQIRNQNRVRQSDLLMRMHLAFSSKEYCGAALKMLSTNYEDYDDFVKKYGHPFAEGSVQTEFLMIGMFFEGIGILTRKKLVDVDLVTKLFGADMFWEKWKPLAEAMRKQMNNPHVAEWLEYLSNETRKAYAHRKA